MYKKYIILLSFCFLIIAKLISFPLLTPYPLALMLIGKNMSFGRGIIFILSAAFVSDIILHTFLNYPLFGMWTIYVNLGNLTIIYLGDRILDRKITTMLLNVATTALMFWIWTNFCVWALDKVYSLDPIGLINCYTLGLPFLKHLLISNVTFAILYVLVLDIVHKNIVLTYRT